jgi:hypothetical protein
MTKPRAKLPHAASVSSIFCKVIERMLLRAAERLKIEWPPEN